MEGGRGAKMGLLTSERIHQLGVKADPRTALDLLAESIPRSLR
jgi:hypothetical protein